MMMSVEGSAGGLAAVKRYYQDYGSRARELKQQGRRIIGYLCAYVPLEIIYAAGFIPFRIKGDVNEPITRADVNMETIVCPLVRSCFDLSVKENYDFLEGIVIPHACDSICRTYDIWKHVLGLPYSHFINMPHIDDDSSLEFYESILNTFTKSLGKYAGREISNDSLVAASKTYNQYRAKVRELAGMRRQNPPLISGAEMTRVLVAGMGIPVEESTSLIGGVIDEVKTRPVTADGHRPRLMVVGAEVDDDAFISLIEDSGAYVVADDLCPGSREYWPDVEITKSPIAGIAERYLRKINCARTYREQKGTYPEYIEARFGHIGRFIKDFNVEGVILYIYKYCDPFGFEVPAMKQYIESFGTPVLYLEDEYSMSTIGRLRTRIQAFLELIGSA
ncbi:2-hydroxyacyl-CoA dehydratase subunit D [Chloroflexota bacterium]